MYDHYGINEKERVGIEEAFGDKAVGILFKNVSKFSIGERDLPLSKVSLMYYVDRHGDFSSPFLSHQRIAKAMFNSLSNSDQLDILKYMEVLNES